MAWSYYAKAPAHRHTPTSGFDYLNVRVRAAANVRRIADAEPQRFHLSIRISRSAALHLTALLPFPFLRSFPHQKSKRAREPSPIAATASDSSRTAIVPSDHSAIDRQKSSPGRDQFACRIGPTSIIHGIVVCHCAGAGGVPAARQPGRLRHGGEQRRGQPLRARHPCQRRPVHLPVHPEGAGAVRQAAGGRHPQGRRHHRQHLAPPPDGSEHGGRGGGAAGAGDQGVRRGRPRQGVPPAVRRRAGGAAPQGLRLLPLHLLRPRHRHALPLHRAPRLLQRLPARLPRPRRPAARAHVLQGCAPPEPSEVREPVGQHVEAGREVHPDRHHGQPRVLVHGLRVVRQGAQEPLRGPAPSCVIDVRAQCSTAAELQFHRPIR